MRYSIETKNLSHRFLNEEEVLKGIDLLVPQGSIFGFLGKNGAGKTTTLKLILGLLKMQGGEVLIFGKKLKDDRVSTLKDIGSLIESPSFYAHLTALENLKILQKVYQCPKERITEVLKIVGLSETGRKKVGQFSLGMKQRLSIGIALLHQPKLLILDEPTNGLDPNGIIEIRELLKDINKKRGTTIVISSHLLSEVEKLVTDLAIINKGALVFQGSLEEIQFMQKETSKIRINTNNAEKAHQLFSENGMNSKVDSQSITIPYIPSKELAQLIKLLVLNDLDIYQVVDETSDLESVFISLTSQ